MSTTQLVQITFVNNHQYAAETREEAAKLTRKLPEEYIALRKAFEAIFKVLDADKVCSACFAGKLYPDRKGHGCCGDCPALSTKGCTSKPIACASFNACDHMGKLFGPEINRVFRILDRQCRDLRMDEEGMSDHCYHISGFVSDAKMKWNERQLRQMNSLRYELVDLRRDIERGYIKRGVSAEDIVNESVLRSRRQKIYDTFHKKHRETERWLPFNVYAPDTSVAA